MEQVPGPYDSPQFGGGESLGEANPGPLKTLGTLNIVFACGLLLCGACYGFYTFMFAALNPAMQAQMQQAQAELEAKHQAEIEELKKKRDSAATDEERDNLQTEIDEAEQNRVPVMPDTSKFTGLSNPLVLGFYITDAATGLVLNIIMLIVGCGLVGVHEWGRKGGVIVSALKIVRLVVLYGVGIALIAPMQSKLIGEGFAEIVKQMPQNQGPPPQVDQMAKVYGIMITGSFAATMILGAIYPAISMWILNRPGAKAATNQPRY